VTTAVASREKHTAINDSVTGANNCSTDKRKVWNQWMFLQRKKQVRCSRGRACWLQMHRTPTSHHHPEVSCSQSIHNQIIELRRDCYQGHQKQEQSLLMWGPVAQSQDRCCHRKTAGHRAVSMGFLHATASHLCTPRQKQWCAVLMLHATE
jgi:hypothetical protein